LALSLGRLLLMSAAVVFVMPAQAQLLEDLVVMPQGNDTVARIGFSGTVRFIQQSPTTPAELYRISFELVAAEEAVLNQTIGEAREYAGSAAVPAFRLSYAINGGRRMKQLTLQLPRKMAVRVRQGPSSRAIDIVFVGLRSSAAAAASSKPIAPVSDKRFAVLLQRVPVAESDKLLPIPQRFQNLETLSTNSVVGGVPMLEISLGYFATEAEAESVRKFAAERFPQASIVDLAQRKQEVLASTAAAQTQAQAQAPAAAPAPAQPPAAPAASVAPPPAPTPAPAAAPAPVITATPEIEKRAAELMGAGRESLTAQKFEAAINSFNQLLLLPPNSQSRDAQELIGVAWERANAPARAKTEYELYIKLFPEGEGAQRVAQRLANLDLGQAAPAPGLRPSGQGTPAAEPSRYSGSIAQYYFGGKARSQSLVNLAAGIDQSTLSKTTESAIVTSVDLGARFASPESETRVVLRGTGATNLQTTSRNPSLVNAAYVDHKRLGSGLAVRLGRQSAISGGLLGLFDGVSMTYPVTQSVKVDLMGGVPANSLVSSPSERLLAAVVEADGILERWGGNVYIIDQTSEGITNRRAVGAEVRYADDTLSMYSLVDYDTVFRGLNAVSVQGTFQAPGQTNVTLLLDARKAPSLQLTNALISSGAASLKTLLQTMSLDDIILAARSTSATAKQALLSVSRPLSERWQLGMDLRYSQIGPLPAVGIFEATPATGAQYGLSTLLTGSNLYSTRDINTVSLSYLTTPLFKGTQLSYSNLTGLRGEVITVEPSLRFYTQNDTQGIKTQRITPGLRLSYKYSQRASLLGETIVERSKTDGPLNHDSSTSVFFYLGYRYELF
jgi:hypothetical protein